MSNASCTSTSTPSIASSFAPAIDGIGHGRGPARSRVEHDQQTLAAHRASVLFDEARQIEREVLADVADVVDDDVAALEVPVVAVAATKWSR